MQLSEPNFPPVERFGVVAFLFGHNKAFFLIAAHLNTQLAVEIADNPIKSVVLSDQKFPVAGVLIDNHKRQFKLCVFVGGSGLHQRLINSDCRFAVLQPLENALDTLRGVVVGCDAAKL